MYRRGVSIISAGFLGALGGTIWPIAAQAQAPLSVAAHYEVFAAGLDIAGVQIDYDIAPRAYQMRVSYHTTGLVSLFASGHNTSSISGLWRGDTALPHRLLVDGAWKGDPRHSDIDFTGSLPIVRSLVPPDTTQRQPVPDAMKAGTIDTLSAMAELMRKAADTGSCDMTVRTYDGHRVLGFDTRTAGPEALTPYRNTTFAGNTLRCDFTATPLAGVKVDDAADARPFRGSIWLAPVNPGSRPIPVRMAFETRWFGDAVMGLLKTEQVPGMVIAGSH